MPKDSTLIGSKRPVITDEELAGVTGAFESIRSVYQKHNTPDTTDIPVPFSDCCAVTAALEELRNIREQSNVADEQPCPIGINRADICSAGTCGQCRELRAAMQLCEHYGLNAGWCFSTRRLAARSSLLAEFVPTICSINFANCSVFRCFAVMLFPAVSSN